MRSTPSNDVRSSNSEDTKRDRECGEELRKKVGEVHTSLKAVKGKRPKAKSLCCPTPPAKSLAPAEGRAFRPKKRIKRVKPLPPEEVEPQGVEVDLESHESDSFDLTDFVEVDGAFPIPEAEEELTGHVAYFGRPSPPRCLEEELESRDEDMFMAM